VGRGARRLVARTAVPGAAGRCNDDPVGWIRRLRGQADPGREAGSGPVLAVRLRDPDLAAAVARDGYARYGPFLDEAEVAAANAVFDEAQRRLAEPLGDSWFPTILLLDDDVRTFITAELGAIIRPKLDAVFEPGSLEVVRLDYSVKPPTETSELGPHQDYTLVDERTAQSLYLWIPLCDTDEVNGTLHVVPGSHHFTNRIRSRHVPAYFDDVLGLVHESSTRLDCRAGELVVMVSGVVHHSPPNRSGRMRLAAHGIVKPAGVPLVFYFADDETPEGRVECYELDIDHYVRSIHHGRPGPEVPLARLEDRPPAMMTSERFERGLAEHRAAGGGPG
jgi:hypothetical protein